MICSSRQWLASERRHYPQDLAVWVTLAGTVARWIVERAEALLQLRCIELNGEWDDFMAWLQQELHKRSNRSIRPPRLFRKKPIQLPDVKTIDLAA